MELQITEVIIRFSKEEKAMRVEDWRQSGKTAWAYAKENGLSPQTFTNWTKARKEAKPCFVEIPTQVVPPQMHAQEILIEKGEIKIHIPLGLSLGELHTIMEGLVGAL